MSTPVNPVQITQNQPVQSQNSPFNEVKNSHTRRKKLLLILGILLLFVLTATGGIWKMQQHQKQQIAKQVMELGVSAQTDYNNGNYKSAEDKLTKALALTNSNPSLFTSLIYAYASDGNSTGQEKQTYQKAKPVIAKALSLYPNNSEILTSIGYITETNGDYDSALRYYNQSLGLDSNNAQTLFHKGHDLEFLGKQNESSSAYDKAYQLDPKNPLIVMGKARQSIFNKKLLDAAGYYDQVANNASASKQMRSEAYLDEAIIKQSQLIYFDQALTLANKAITIDDSYSPALVFYGFLLSIQNKFKTGTSYIDRGIKLNPRIAQNYYYMGLTLKNGKYYSSAINYFKYGYLLIDNDNTLVSQSQKDTLRSKIAYELARSLSLNGGSPETLNYLKKAITINPQLKKVLNIDLTRLHYFSELSTNEEFKKLLN